VKIKIKGTKKYFALLLSWYWTRPWHATVTSCHAGLNTHTQHHFTFFSQYISDVLQTICSQDVVNELLHHLAQQTCMYQCHVTPAASKVLILIISPVESVRMWRVLKFYYEAICVFIKEYTEQPFRTNIPLILQKAKQSALEMTQATI
jgi:hypothetical protein